ncbi:MAG: CatA-like O-acetyltransferase [Thomasclavelia sp.]|uniref:CatA-like O-acetyltransferase n=1 Tax=Thomasclavelia sp. TaxID=3025757 RepID=UPI00399F4829
MIWVVLTIINAHDEFKYGWDEWKFLASVITWGKYEAENNKLILPLTMNIHHAVADGFHISRFFNEVQKLINDISNNEF